MSIQARCGSLDRRNTPRSVALGWPWLDHPAYYHSEELQDTFSIPEPKSNLKPIQELDLQDTATSFPEGRQHRCKEPSRIEPARPSFSRSTTVAPRKPSVDALVNLFETKERLSRTTTAKLDHPFTNPSPSLQRRYTTALHSQKQNTSNYQPEAFVPQQAHHTEDLRKIEQLLADRLSNISAAPSEPAPPPDRFPTSDKPRIRVKTSSRSVSIIIPEGFKLPIVATIHTAGSFDAQMSSANAEEGSESGSNVGATPRPQRKQRRATISGQSTDTTTRDSESQDASVGLVLPFLARISKGRLNVSEASIPAPRSTDISAQGQVFTPTHEHSRELGTEVGQGHPEERSPTADSERSGQSDKTISNVAAASGKAITAAENEVTAPLGSTSGTEPGDTGTARTPPDLTPRLDDALDQIANTSPQVESLEPLGIPQIRVHRPSGTIMPPSFETSAKDSVDVPPTPLPTPAQSPAEATRTLSEAIENVTAAVPLPSTGPVDPSPDTSAGLGNDIANTTSAMPGQTDDGVPPKAKKGLRRKKAVREARKIVVRKSFLKIILGRKLGSDVHRRLNQANSSVAASPQPLDGANDLPSASSLRDVRRRDARQRQLGRRIVVAKALAQAEGLEECPTCGGAMRTTCLQRFYRLNLERDRPDMSIAERHAAALAKAAAVLCHCPKEWMGAGRSGFVRGINLGQ